MGLLGSLFTRPLREPRDTTDDALNAVFVPLRNRVCDFKDITNMSWALILPAIQRISIRLFIQAHGRQSTQQFLRDHTSIPWIDEKSLLGRGQAIFVGE